MDVITITVDLESDDVMRVTMARYSATHQLKSPEKQCDWLDSREMPSHIQPSRLTDVTGRKHYSEKSLIMVGILREVIKLYIYTVRKWLLFRRPLTWQGGHPVIGSMAEPKVGCSWLHLPSAGIYVSVFTGLEINFQVAAQSRDSIFRSRIYQVCGYSAVGMESLEFK